MRHLKSVALALLIVLTQQIANAQSLGDLLKGIGGSDVISNVIEGVFTKTDLTLADLVGEYQATGPAVTFKSENLLQKAGGIAGAASIESKLQPYYEKYGLTGMTLTIDESANYTMQIKSLKLSGTITKNESEGTFEFNFKVAGINLGKFKAYIEKSGSTLKLMFDATKLKSFISTVTKLTGNSIASTVSSVLESYDGACIGFKMTNISSSNNSTTNSSTDSQNSSSSVLDALKGVLNKGK